MGEIRDEELDRRVAGRRAELRAALEGLYGSGADDLTDRLIDQTLAGARRRPTELVELDRRRELETDWYQRPERAGYIAYAERFGGTLRGVGERLDHLLDLGVDTLHLMSVMRPRPGDSDGGYAIEDYLRPDPELGDVEDLRWLTSELRRHGIALCLDFVLNHTADTHEWVRLARSGSERHRARYLTFPDRELPDRFEATLPEVFPQLAPGNFTWDDDLGRWVWTTFREFQWDLDWANPDVMLAMAEVLVDLVNLGVDIVRLDAIAFTWKRLGTDCQNQPEAHLVAQALAAVVGIAAPGVALLAEAIVGPDQLIGYLGVHELERRECHLAYHNQLMVQVWSMLATREAALASAALGRLPAAPESTSWFSYVRCHDDIGWAIDDGDAAAVGFDGFAHRAFLAAFFRGDFPDSFARGRPFASNPETGDERTSGMTATLCGLAAAQELDGHERDAAIGTAISRHLLTYAIAAGFGGIPMIYLGDELGQLDDPAYLDDPDRRADSRWSHRPHLDLAAARHRNDPDTVAGRVWTGMRRILVARAACPPLHGAGRTEIVGSGHGSVFAWRRRHPRHGVLLGLANVAERPAVLDEHVLDAGRGSPVIDLLDEAALVRDDQRHLAPYQVRWLTADTRYRTVPPPGPRLRPDLDRGGP